MCQLLTFYCSQLFGSSNQPSSGSTSPSPLCLESFRSTNAGGGCPTSTGGTRSPRVAALVLPRTLGVDPSSGAEDGTGSHYQPSPLRLNILQSSKLQQYQRSYGSLLHQQQQMQLQEAEELDFQLDSELAEVLAAAAAAADEADGQRRDSGVLVEDSEPLGENEMCSTATTNTTPTSTSTFPASAVQPMPSLVNVDRFVGRMLVNSR